MATTDTTSDLHPSFRNFCDKLVENNYFLRVSKSELYFQLVTRSSGGDSGTTSIWDSWPNSGGKLLLFLQGAFLKMSYFGQNPRFWVKKGLFKSFLGQKMDF